MAKIVKQHLGRQCYFWVKGNRVPLVGVIGYDHARELVSVRTSKGETFLFKDEEVSYIQCVCLLF